MRAWGWATLLSASLVSGPVSVSPHEKCSIFHVATAPALYLWWWLHSIIKRSSCMHWIQMIYLIAVDNVKTKQAFIWICLKYSCILNESFMSAGRGNLPTMCGFGQTCRSMRILEYSLFQARAILHESTQHIFCHKWLRKPLNSSLPSLIMFWSFSPLLLFFCIFSSSSRFQLGPFSTPLPICLKRLSMKDTHVPLWIKSGLLGRSDVGVYSSLISGRRWRCCFECVCEGRGWLWFLVRWPAVIHLDSHYL